MRYTVTDIVWDIDCSQEEYPTELRKNNLPTERWSMPPPLTDRRCTLRRARMVSLDLVRRSSICTRSR